MLQYLIILLDSTSISFCHCNNNKKEPKLIPLDILRSGILYGMKENLMIQFVYPEYDLPQEYKDIVESIDHSKIMPSNMNDADVIVFKKWQELVDCSLLATKTYVLRICKNDLFSQCDLIKATFGKIARLNVIITDVETFTEEDFNMYKECLEIWTEELLQLYFDGKSPQFNLLTDRILLDKMNNCGAGDTSITLAPDGDFYICPAFYFDEQMDGSEQSLRDVCSKGYSIGSVAEGVDVRNQQLYRLTNAPLCRVCDAYQCKRCVWLNRKTTYEVNTPSHEQCVVAHLERNASKVLLNSIRKSGDFLNGKNIRDIDYLDPIVVKKLW